MYDPSGGIERMVYCIIIPGRNGFARDSIEQCILSSGFSQ